MTAAADADADADAVNAAGMREGGKRLSWELDVKEEEEFDNVDKLTGVNFAQFVW